MRITCPCCGERDLSEFSYRGDATLERPDAALQDARQHFIEYVYIRNNPAGPHPEFWHHTLGCQSWLVVTRNTATHEVVGVVRAADRRTRALS